MKIIEMLFVHHYHFFLLLFYYYHLLKHNKAFAAGILQQNEISVSSPYYDRITEGGSGGISIVCAFLSLALNKIVPANIAFTDEVSANGQLIDN